MAETGLNLRVIQVGDFILLLRCRYALLFQVWFQNKRSKERKGGKSMEKKDAPDDDDEPGDDSQPSSPPAASESTPAVSTES